MPLKTCKSDGQPGFKFGDSGTCYTYTAGDEDAKLAAKKKAIKQAIAIGGGKAPRELERDLDAESRRLLAEDAELQTVDLLGIEIMSAGGPVHGVGSPPEGDFWSAEDLRSMAEAAQELEEAGEFEPPARIGDEAKLGKSKLGHSKDQKLLTDSELPAAGWLSNQRVSEDGTKLLADVKSVPKKVAQLIKAKAYSKRSAELGKVTSQKTGKTYDWVVTGLAWLGGKMPAVRTLDDVVAQYEAEGLSLDLQRVVQYEDQVVWDPGEGLEAIRSAVREALNPGPSMNESRYWVRDVTAGKVLVSEGWSEDADAYVIGFTRSADGSVELEPSADWKAAEQQWVAAAKSYSAKNRDAADTRPMPEITLDEKAQRELAAELGLKEDEELSPEKLLEAVKAKGETTEGDDGGDGGEGDGEGGGEEQTEAQRALEARVEVAEKKAEETAEKLRLEERRYFVDDLVKSGKIEPGEREKWETRYDKDAEMARSFAEDLEIQPQLVREYGDDGDGTEEDQEANERAYEADAQARLGIDKESVV